MANTTVTLSKELTTYYVRTFLKNANNKFVFDTGAQKRTIPAGDGKSIHFNRYNPLDPAVTPLTEGSSGTSVDLQEVEITATVQEYGKYAQISKLLSATSIDLNAKAKIELFRDNMLATLDTLIRNELSANLHQQTATTLSVDIIAEAVAYMETKKAFKYSDGYFLGFVGPNMKKALMADSKWLYPHQYKDTTNIYKGEIGSVMSVRWLESSTIEDGQTSNFPVIIVGRESYGTTDLAKDKPKLYLNGSQFTAGQELSFDDGDKSDPLNRFQTLGWAGSFAAKVLNPDWGVAIQVPVPTTSGSGESGSGS